MSHPTATVTGSAARRRALAARSPGLGAAELIALARADPDLEMLDRPQAAALARLGLTTRTVQWLLHPNQARIEADLRWLELSGTTLLAVTDAAYPPMLRQLVDAPPILFVRGNRDLLHEPQLAMVGSRNPTAGGLSTARDFAKWFTRAGIVVTSGLALGIDAACHEGALAAGGPTVAVLGCGIDIVYPAANRALAQRIVENGAIVSEFPPGLEPRKELFPQRNRIIAGLSYGTLVVEAARESGSLITARLAGNAGREVFAIPGSIHNPCARGCHQLIRQGAKLVERAEDVLEELKIPLSCQLLATPSLPVAEGAKPAPQLDKAYEILLDALAFEPASVDSLIERTGLNSEDRKSVV